MLRHYLTATYRNLRKNRAFTLINSIGLGLGIAAFGLIWEYVAFEHSVDQFHQKLPHLYRVLMQADNGQSLEYVPAGLSPDAKRAFPTIDDACRVVTGPANGIVSIETPGKSVVSYRENNTAYVDGSFFNLFSFPLIEGAKNALQQPHTAFVSETTAKNYFGSATAMGRLITLSNQFGKHVYTVRGIYADMPENSNMRFDVVYALASLNNLADRNGEGWADPASYDAEFLQAALLLKLGTNPDALAQQLTRFYHARKPDKIATSVRLQPARYAHLGQSLNDPLTTAGSLGFVYLLSGLALLIVLIAWLNYVNLSTATALTRAKEVGVRKVVGATRGQLVAQVLGESLLINAIGMGLGILLLMLVQPVFNQFVGKQLSIGTLLAGRQGDVGLWFWALLALLGGALLSGGYVAVALTRTRPIDMMRGGLGTLGRGTWLRQGLVVVQFGIALMLIVATLVMTRQVTYLQNRPLGVHFDRLLTIIGPEIGKDQADFRTRASTFQQQVQQQAFVQATCLSGNVPGSWYNFNSPGITRQNPQPGDDQKTYSILFVDDRYLPTFGIKMLAGRNVNRAETEAKGSTSVLINERAARELGFASAQAAINQLIVWGDQRYVVVGVMANYRHLSPKKPVDPMVLFPRAYSSYLTVRLAPGNTTAQLATLERLYRASFPGNPFDYYQTIDRYNEQYQLEKQYGQVFSAAAGLAIFIACLGLFGLAAFTAQRRTKEIGVRKVLGASEVSILALLSGDFLRLIGIAFVIACPIAWWAMSQWLQGFAEKTPLHWWLFAAAGAIATGVALLTILSQSLRAARTNPVKSLRME